ncbi:MAG: hypothetical protein ACI3XG_04660, partial [Faecousia sp.]
MSGTIPFSETLRYITRREADSLPHSQFTQKKLQGCSLLMGTALFGMYLILGEQGLLAVLDDGASFDDADEGVL